MPPVVTESIFKSLLISTLTKVVAFLVPSSFNASTVTIDTFVLAPSTNFTSSLGFTLSYTFASLLKSTAVPSDFTASLPLALPIFQPESWIAFATVLPVTNPAPLLVTESVVGLIVNGVPAGLPSLSFSKPTGLPFSSTL